MLFGQMRCLNCSKLVSTMSEIIFRSCFISCETIKGFLINIEGHLHLSRIMILVKRSCLQYILPLNLILITHFKNQALNIAWHFKNYYLTLYPSQTARFKSPGLPLIEKEHEIKCSLDSFLGSILYKNVKIQNYYLTP